MAKQESGHVRAWIATQGVPVGDPLADPTNWDELGREIAGQDPSITPNGQTDTNGAPLYSSSSIDHDRMFTDLDQFDVVQARELAEVLVVIGVLKPNGTFEYTKNVECSARIIPAVDKTDFIKLGISLYGSALSQDDLISTTFTP